MPGGVSSPVRAFGAVGGTPYFVARGEGPYLWDADGQRRIDLVQSYGAIILGHAHPAVVEAVHRATRDGTSYGAPTEREVRLAEAICGRLPSVEQVRLTSSGTEATMTAIRLARGCTGRNRIVKFSGCYHGHGDALLAASGSGVATLGLPGSAGVPPGAVADTTVAPYNVVPELDETIAAVIVEPVAANMGLVAPSPGFLAALRRACDEVGALLIFDEVITGFRLGLAGAQGHYGVTPDLTALGKVIGGGLPLAAVGGRADLLRSLAPEGPIYQAGTLSGNPLATAAGLAVLDELDHAAYESLEARASQLASGLEKVLRDADIAACVPRVGTLVGVYFGPDPPRDYEGASRTDEAAYGRFFHGLLRQGVAIAPGAYEVLFPGFAHNEAVIDDVIGFAADAVTGTGAPKGQS